MKSILFLFALSTVFAKEMCFISNPYCPAPELVTLEEELEPPRPKSIYLAAGVSHLFIPTLTLGMRFPYKSFASDISISGVIPAIHYKQLVYLSESRRSSPYVGFKIGTYFLDLKYSFLDLGGIIGFQIYGVKLDQFLELGFGTPVFSVCGKSDWALPSLSYGLLF